MIGQNLERLVIRCQQFVTMRSGTRVTSPSEVSASVYLRLS